MGWRWGFDIASIVVCRFPGRVGSHGLYNMWVLIVGCDNRYADTCWIGFVGVASVGLLTGLMCWLIMGFPG